MPGQSIGKTFNYGYPGSFSRNGDCVIANRVLKSTDTDNINFGGPVVLNSDNTVSALLASGTAAAFAGVAVREVKQADQYSAQTALAYKPGQPVDYITRGSVMVTVNAGTPTAGGSVYIRVAAAAAGKPIGGFEAAADSTNTILLTNAEFTTGYKDTNNIAEITLLNRQA